MRTPSRSLLRAYQAAIEEHLSGAGEAALKHGYEVGRRALDQGLGIVDLGALYQRALACVLSSASTTAECVKIVESLESLFVESLSPYEMTHRGYRESYAALRHLNDLLEDEAKRIALALHDESGQLLVAVHLALEELSRSLPAGFEMGVHRVRTALEEMEGQLHRLSRELRPPILDDLGLLPALQFLVDGVSRRSGLSVALAGLSKERLPPLVEIVLYRIVQEALNNATSHAKARRVIIRFERPGKAILHCSIQDDGIGFDVPEVWGARGKKGLGLAGMQERLKALDGTLEIKSSPGGGTELRIQVPLGS
ncbi:MAG: sensor histidine kinase [Terriglobia bacterium]